MLDWYKGVLLKREGTNDNFGIHEDIAASIFGTGTYNVKERAQTVAAPPLEPLSPESKDSMKRLQFAGDNHEGPGYGDAGYGSIFHFPENREQEKVLRAALEEAESRRDSAGCECQESGAKGDVANLEGDVAKLAAKLDGSFEAAEDQ